LLAARFSMAFRFQAVAALSPFVMDRFAIGLADSGLLIRVCFIPGVLVAMPGAAIGRCFGDERTVAFGMLPMLAGGLAIALVPAWAVQIAGRAVAGIGGIRLNVPRPAPGAEPRRCHGQLRQLLAGRPRRSPPRAATDSRRLGLEAALGTVAGLVLIGLLLLLN
jgi:MFS family permease